MTKIMAKWQICVETSMTYICIGEIRSMDIGGGGGPKDLPY